MGGVQACCSTEEHDVACFAPGPGAAYLGGSRDAACCYAADDASELAAFHPGFLLSEATSGLQYDEASPGRDRDANDPASVAFWRELREALEPMSPPVEDRGFARSPVPPKLRLGARPAEEEQLFSDMLEMVKADIGSERARLPQELRAPMTPRGPGPRERMTPRAFPRTASPSERMMTPRGPRTPRGPVTPVDPRSPPPPMEGEAQESVLHEVAAQLSMNRSGLLSWIKEREQELNSARRGLPVLREQEEPEVCPERGSAREEPEVSPEGDQYIVPESDEIVEPPIVAPLVPAAPATGEEKGKPTRGMWVVISKCPVRSSQSVHGAVTAVKYPGEVVFGYRDDDWLFLDDVGGFCLIKNRGLIYLKGKSSL